MIKQIAHVCFIVKDLDRSIDFYVNKLGLKPGFDFTNETGKRFGVYLGVGNRTFLELFEGNTAEGGPSGSYKHLCLEVQDLRSAVEFLEGHGIEITPPKLGSDQSWQAWLSDPDGNRIELHCYTPDSRQNPLL